MNVDASFYLDAGSGAMGALFLDSEGAFIASSCSYKEFSMDVASVKVYALPKGLGLADELAIYSVVVECNSPEVVHAILDLWYLMIVVS